MLSKRSILPAVVVLALACSATAMASTVTTPSDVGLLTALVEDATSVLDAMLGWLPGFGTQPAEGTAPGATPGGDQPQTSSPAASGADSGTVLPGSGGDESSGPWPVTQP